VLGLGASLAGLGHLGLHHGAMHMGRPQPTAPVDRRSPDLLQRLMMMLKTTLASGALAAAVLGSGHAEARTWWIYNFGQDRCQIAQFSPDQMIQSMRDDNRLNGPPSVKTYRDNSGVVAGVEIEDTYTTGNALQLLFFDNQLCRENVRQDMIKDGYAQDRREQ
jgi:hypothetical protein